MPEPEVTLCTRCVLPSTFPGITFDASGVCNLCQDAPPPPDLIRRQDELRAGLEALFDEHRGKAEYDCIVAFSGGKDSSYTLKMLTQRYKLHCLAVTIDNGFIAEQAQKNLRTVTSALGVDFMLYTPAPAFMKKLYLTSATDQVHTRAALTRASSMCNSCIGLINNHMVKLALEKGVPIIAGGYIGGQVPQDAVMTHMDLDVQARFRTESVKRYLKHFGPEAKGYFGVDESLLATSRVRKLAIVNPMLALPVSEEEIIASIETLGWRKTSDTGKNSTNCLLNDLGVAVHFKQHGFNPYVMEVAEQVRGGLMSRDEALAKVTEIPSYEHVEHQAIQIGLPRHAVGR